MGARLSADAVGRAVQESRPTESFRRFAGPPREERVATSDVQNPAGRRARTLRTRGMHRDRPVSTGGRYGAAKHEEGGRVPEVEAHITGTVWKIEVAVGDSVEEGDTV